MPEKESTRTVISRTSLLEKFVPVILVICVGLAFVVGVLWQKVSSLEAGATRIAGVNAGNGSGETPTDTNAVLPTNGKLSEAESKKVVAVNDKDRIRGSLDAEVFLIEYSDLECPFCKQFHGTAQRVVDEYEGKVTWAYRHFPLDMLHPKADKEAEGAECAYEQKGQDGFWAYVDQVFKVTPSNNGLDLETLPDIAEDAGLSKANFSSCLDSEKYKEEVERQYQEGVTAGVTGTPGNFIMNKKGEVWVVPGAVPFESLKGIIDEALLSS